jgi:hypothetical protein
MEQPSQQQPKKSPLVLAFHMIVVLLILGAAAQVLQIRGLSDRVAELESRLVAQAEADLAARLADDRNDSGWNTTVKSGRGGFEVTLPDGWGPIINDTTGDFMVMMGKVQPTMVKGGKVEVKETQGFGTDSPSLFMIALGDASMFSQPQGEAQEFTFSNNKNPMKGTKYTYAYPKDITPDGLGARLAGDLDYTYIVPVGDKELRIHYSVYGSDPRNLVETVDEIVQRIVLLEQ